MPRRKPTEPLQKVTNPQVDFTEMPFQVWRSRPRVMARSHVHTDIEGNLLLSGAMRYFFAGRFFDIVPGEFALFWAGMPHRLVQVAPETEYIVFTLPLAWFLAWSLSESFTASLLAGQMQIHPSEPAPFERWSADCRTNQAELRRIALLEVEAFLRRLALRRAASAGAPRPLQTEASATAGPVETLAAYVARRYQEPLTVAEIAAAACLHPHYAMTVFRHGCGLTLGEYVARLRISHAQRLLLTTDWTCERISGQCGFGSTRRFFAAFRQYAGDTPHRYRRRAGEK